MRKSDYDRNYMKQNCKVYRLQLNKENDKDIIEWLDRQTNKNGAIKTVLREKIKAE